MLARLSRRLARLSRPGIVRLLLGGKVYRPDASGHVAVSKDALAAAAATGGVTLIAPGMAPLRLAPDQLDRPIALTPAPPQGPAPTGPAPAAQAVSA